MRQKDSELLKFTSQERLGPGFLTLGPKLCLSVVFVESCWHSCRRDKFHISREGMRCTHGSNEGQYKSSLLQTRKAIIETNSSFSRIKVGWGEV